MLLSAGRPMRSLVLFGILLMQGCALPGYDRYPAGSPRQVPVEDRGEPHREEHHEPAPESVPEQPEPAPAREPRSAPRTVERMESSSNPAVVELMAQADEYLQAGRHAEAAATLERAQRIAPRDPRIYQQLGAVKLAQGNPAQGEQMARKSLALASGQTRLQADLWELIADCRRARGDAAGEDAAREEAQRLRREDWRWWK